ncbi:MAG: lipoyl synthase [Acidimicrobiia bacterium]|nr:lipoyl synthase [Acidimicrobiia bacterium]
MAGSGPLRVRWLGTVSYREALDLQRALFTERRGDWLLLVEHPHVVTLGVRADRAHLRVDPASVGAELVEADRGGDVTYHGPGQLVGYPILDVPGRRGGGMADTVAHVTAVEDVVIDALAAVGLTDVGRLRGLPGVWVEPTGTAPRKIAAVGVRISRGRSMHGFALNVAPDLSMFDAIVPCGLDRPVTSLAAEGIDVTMRHVVDAVVDAAGRRWARRGIERAEVVWRHTPEDLSAFTLAAEQGGSATDTAGGAVLGAVGVSVAPAAAGVTAGGTTPRRRRRLTEAGVAEGLQIATRKPEWLRAPVRHDADVLATRAQVRAAGLVTVCEEAGCPNLSECWSAGTATFMLNGERCTRACGFCLVDTRHPAPLDPGEPERVADAVAAMGLEHAVLTAVARDDLPDGGASGFARTIEAIRRRSPTTRIEVLIPDVRGDAGALDVVLAASPDVVNHNLETVARLQRAVRPSAGYARSLTVLARAGAAGFVTKSGLMVGLGERPEEVRAAMADLAGVGVDIVTVGQYLRPTDAHLPVVRWVPPAEFDALARFGVEELGLAHVEASPLTRSSYHAADAASAAAGSTPQLAAR